MASLLSEEQFQCCICLDVFNQPVSIPCGHNFCLPCIRRFWETQKRCECPLCKESFPRQPDLRINRGLADITEHFKRSLKVKVRQGQGDGEGAAVRASTTRGSSPGRQGRQCGLHQRPLELFCRNDRKVICSRCAQTEHRGHNTVPADRESARMRAELSDTKAEVERMIQERQQKLESTEHSLQLSKLSKERETENGQQIFMALLRSVERLQAELVEEMEEKQREVERRAGHLTQELRQEINELVKRRTELECLSNSEDQYQLFQSFSSLTTLPHMKNWSEISVPSEHRPASIRRAVSKLQEILNSQEKTLCEEELRHAQQHSVDVTLDPVTASPWVILSADLKQVSLSYQPLSRPLPDDPRRFDSCVCVLGREAFSSGRRYWVVQVGDKTDWDLGVARESINRKGGITVRPDQGFWAVCRRKGASLNACAGPSVTLSLPHTPRKVGVFLDYEGGLVSFYDVENKSHIYTFSGCSFNETVYPYFNPCLHDNGKNTAPLIICATGNQAVTPTDPQPQGPVGQSGPMRGRPSYHRPLTHQTQF
ncbi:E3 ubiquitin-protein ligase TRIM39-like [Chanos chanos]|uniref:E3 ubiquitin-protein ligase TRIM39-like n=1 Tax=Chanos chanos TaxID=29144 RepID=A0A6J2VTD2_CHACN|nr:E3 ubiquitin-protein ligase TRIM39-like [Chanos chanos]